MVNYMFFFSQTLKFHKWACKKVQSFENFKRNSRVWWKNFLKVIKIVWQLDIHRERGKKTCYFWRYWQKKWLNQRENIFLSRKSSSSVVIRWVKKAMMKKKRKSFIFEKAKNLLVKKKEKFSLKIKFLKLRREHTAQNAIPCDEREKKIFKFKSHEFIFDSEKIPKCSGMHFRSFALRLMCLKCVQSPPQTEIFVTQLKRL